MKSMEQMRQKLRQLMKEIENFQEKCNHKNQIIKFDEKKNARWFCVRCDKMLRLPSYKELQDWIQK
tara:strand:+ start:624 stop:821 length:198 start_codon:yes stop_codon:yes gene_type:complete